MLGAVMIAMGVYAKVYRVSAVLSWRLWLKVARRDGEPGRAGRRVIDLAHLQRPALRLGAFFRITLLTLQQDGSRTPAATQRRINSTQ